MISKIVVNNVTVYWKQNGDTISITVRIIVLTKEVTAITDTHNDKMNFTENRKRYKKAQPNKMYNKKQAIFKTQPTM